MTSVTKDQIATVALSLRVDGKPSFMLLLTSDDHVKRMGTSAIDDWSQTVATGREPGVFDAFVAELDEGLLSRADAYEDVDGPGPRCHWRIELGGGRETVRFELRFDGERASLPTELAVVVALAERLTDPWYAEQVRERTGAEPVLATHGPASTTVAEGAGPPPTPIAPLVVEASPPPPVVSAVEEVATADPRRDADSPPAPTSPEPTPSDSLQPKASRKRIAFVVLLDLIVIGVPYTLFKALFGLSEPGDGPPGAGLMLFALLEFSLLQIVRRSPAMWLLGMKAALGDAPRVEAAFLSRESLLTHAVGAVFLGWGAESLTQWTTYHTPVPYFGLPFGTVLSVLVTVLLGAAFAAAGVLILRMDLRGVWAGAGATAFAFLSLWFARGYDLDAWAAAEVANRRAWRGQPVQAGEVEAFQAMIAPILLVITALTIAGLYGTWKRFDGRKTGGGPGA